MEPAMPDLLDRLREEVVHETGSEWERSSLAEWMTTHHAKAAELLNHLDWAHEAELFAEQGLQEKSNQPPTAQTARKTGKREKERRRTGLKLRKAK
jgi:hypothetical protein